MSNPFKELQERLDAQGEQIHSLDQDIRRLLPNSSESIRRAEEYMFNGLRGRSNLYLGTVVDTRDRYMLGRIRFRMHGMMPALYPEEKTFVAEPIIPFGGLDDSGSVWVPPVGAQVAIIPSGGAHPVYYYIGTVPRHIGLNVLGKRELPKGIKHFDERWAEEGVYNGRRDGHLSGDEYEELPPWSAEAYRNVQMGAKEDKETDYPSTQGFKSMEKHLLKLCDGFFDQKLMGKRVVLQSSKGNMLYMKDDILFAPQEYEFGSPPASEADLDSDVKLRSSLYETYPLLPDDLGDPWEKIPHTTNNHVVVYGTVLTCGSHLPPVEDDDDAPDFSMLHDISLKPDAPKSAFLKERILPRTGAILQSVMGGRLIIDDDFDPEEELDEAYQKYPQFYQLSDKDKLRSFIKLESISEHSIVLCDDESESYVRSPYNGIYVESAKGNSIALIDHMLDKDTRGALMGVSIQSTTGHQLRFYDQAGDLYGPYRKKWGETVRNSENAMVVLKSGFGQMIRIMDGPEQDKAGNQTFLIHQPESPMVNPESTSQMGSPGNQIFMTTGAEGKQQLVWIKAAKNRFDVTEEHYIHSVGGWEINRRNKGHLSMNKDYGEDFNTKGGGMTPSLEFAKYKLVGTDGNIILWGGYDGLSEALDGKGGTQNTEASEGMSEVGPGSDSDSDQAPILPVLVYHGHAPCPLLGSNFGCLYFKDQAPVSEHVWASGRKE